MFIVKVRFDGKSQGNYSTDAAAKLCNDGSRSFCRFRTCEPGFFLFTIGSVFSSVS